MAHTPRKRFGQNFLHDPGVIGRIVAAIHPLPSESLVEIGPGQGAITLPLLQAAGKLTAVELDRDLVQPLLNRCRGAGGLQVINRDALRFDFCELAGAGALRVIGNLPYNISTPLLFHLLDQQRCIVDMHFMLQKEVVERMAAAPGSGQYGRLSVMLQYRCQVDMLFTIGPGAFNPPPKVDSAFVRLTPWPAPPVRVDDEQVFANVVRHAFAQRRKTLRNTLRELLDANTISAAGVDPTARAETLTLNEFAALANEAARRDQDIPGQ
jgi:16S rRNA (adenine1518-N6/adenine1519-N6)-dimethyltransferase